MGVTAWCLRTWPPLLIKSISHTYILDISKNYFKPLVKLIFVQSVKNPYSNSFASLHGGTLVLQLIVVRRWASVWPYVCQLRARHQGGCCGPRVQGGGRPCGSAKMAENSASRASMRLSLAQAYNARLGGPAQAAPANTVILALE